jgi:hypothetical protein
LIQPKVKGVEKLIDLILAINTPESALQHVFLALQQHILLQTHLNAAYGRRGCRPPAFVAGLTQIKSALRLGGLQ